MLKKILILTLIAAVVLSFSSPIVANNGNGAKIVECGEDCEEHEDGKCIYLPNDKASEAAENPIHVAGS